jgi:hypothetical protein
METFPFQFDKKGSTGLIMKYNTNKIHKKYKIMILLKVHISRGQVPLHSHVSNGRCIETCPPASLAKQWISSE